jgi:ABC-type amino acid transport substrate-binding protein
MISFCHPFRLRGLGGCLLTLCLFISPASVVSDDAVSICFVEWRPYARMTDNGAEGISVSIIKKAAQLLEREVRFVEHSWNECLQKVKDGELDVILDAALREDYLQGPTSFSIYSDTFWVSDERKVSRYEQLSGGTVALVEGYNYDPRLLAHIEDLDLDIVRGADDLTIVRDMAQGSVDAAVADLASTFTVIREERLKAYPILPPFTYDRLYASFHRGKADLQREFDRAFAQLIKQGYVDEVYTKTIGTAFSSFVISE